MTKCHVLRSETLHGKKANLDSVDFCGASHQRFENHHMQRLLLQLVGHEAVLVSVSFMAVLPPRAFTNGMSLVLATFQVAREAEACLKVCVAAEPGLEEPRSPDSIH